MSVRARAATAATAAPAVPAAPDEPRESRLAQVLRVGLGGRDGLGGLGGRGELAPPTGVCADEEYQRGPANPQPVAIANLAHLPHVVGWRPGATREERTRPARSLAEEGPEVRIWEQIAPVLKRGVLFENPEPITPKTTTAERSGMVYLLDAGNLFHVCWDYVQGKEGEQFFGFSRYNAVQDDLAAWRKNAVPNDDPRKRQLPKGEAGAVVLVTNSESYWYYEYWMTALLEATAVLHEWKHPFIVVEAQIRTCDDRRKRRDPDGKEEMDGDYNCVEYYTQDARYRDYSRSTDRGERACRIRVPQKNVIEDWETVGSEARHSLCELDDLLLQRLQRRYLWTRTPGGGADPESAWKQLAYAGVACTNDERQRRQTDDELRADGDVFALLDDALEFAVHVLPPQQVADYRPQGPQQRPKWAPPPQPPRRPPPRR